MKRWYWSFRQRLQGEVARIDERLKPLYIPWQQHDNGGVYAVDICARVGLFAQMNWLLYVLEHCERRALKPWVRLSSPYYCAPTRGADWLEHFFDWRQLGPQERAQIASGQCRLSRATTVEQLGFPDSYARDMRLRRARHLLDLHLLPKPALLAQVDGFVEREFGPEPIIGLHYRGTDKVTEAPQVPWEDAIAAVRDLALRQPQFRSVFVASDDANFITYAMQALRPLRVITHDDQERSSDGLAVHTRIGVGDQYRKAEEALVNCLLLARCGALVRTASFLSGWASVFNPELPVVMLNRPYAGKTWFPDREVLRQADGVATA